jgi:hypothetical protein
MNLSSDQPCGQTSGKFARLMGSVHSATECRVHFSRSDLLSGCGFTSRERIIFIAFVITFQYLIVVLQEATRDTESNISSNSRGRWQLEGGGHRVAHGDVRTREQLWAFTHPCPLLLFSANQSSTICYCYSASSYFTPETMHQNTNTCCPFSRLRHQASIVTVGFGCHVIKTQTEH